MILRDINLYKLIFYLGRGNFMLNAEQKLNTLYKILFCSFVEVHKRWQEYYAKRRLYQLISTCTCTYRHLENVLNWENKEGKIERYNFNKYGKITLKKGLNAKTFLYSEEREDKKTTFLYNNSTDLETQTMLSSTQRGVSRNLIITIPRGLKEDEELYSLFVSTLETIILEGINYKILLKETA